MLHKLLLNLKQALIFTFFLLIITGIVYPALVTLCGQALFAVQANGSLIMQDKRIIGSQLLGQNFTEKKYFWGRPSVTKDFPYNASSSVGSNLGPSNPVLITAVQARITFLKQANPENNNHVPTDLITSSASGLDPHISLAAAYYQAARVATERKLSINNVTDLINKYSILNSIPGFGVPHVNVLALNLALDKINKTQEVK